MPNATPTILPKLLVHQMYPTELKGGNILYSEQRAFSTTFIEGIEVANLDDIENAPRFTATPNGKTDDTIYTQWMNDYSSYIDLEKLEWSVIFIVLYKDQSIILQGYDAKGNERTQQDAKVLAYKQLGIPIK